MGIWSRWRSWRRVSQIPYAVRPAISSAGTMLMDSRPSSRKGLEIGNELSCWERSLGYYDNFDSSNAIGAFHPQEIYPTRCRSPILVPTIPLETVEPWRLHSPAHQGADPLATDVIERHRHGTWPRKRVDHLGAAPRGSGPDKKSGERCRIRFADRRDVQVVRQRRDSGIRAGVEGEQGAVHRQRTDI